MLSIQWSRWLSTAPHLEHALQLVGELGTTLGLELGDHRLLRVVAGALAQQQPPGKVLLVEGFEDILALQGQCGVRL